MNHVIAGIAFMLSASLLQAQPIGGAKPLPHATANATARALPADSLYQVDAPLQTADGRAMHFAAPGSHVRIVTMFYANCPMACPLTIDTLRNIDAALSPAQRSKLEVLLITMDPERDTPQALHAVARERRIEDKRWTLARASAPDTRKLAALLGIQYRALDNAEFDHASVLVLLDAEGRPLARTSKLGVPAPEFLSAVRQAIE
jgi:protein SCO1/2